MSALARLPDHVAHSGIYRQLAQLPTEPRGQDGNRHGSWMHAIEQARIGSGSRKQTLAPQVFLDSQTIARSGVRLSNVVTQDVAALQPESAASLATRIGTRNRWYDDDSASSQGLASETPAQMVRQLAELANLISVEALHASSSKALELWPQGSVPEPLRICWQWREDGSHDAVQLWLGADRDCLTHLPNIIDFLRRSLEARGVHLCSLVCNGEERLGTSAMRARKSAELTVSERPQSADARLFHDTAYVI